MYCRYEREIPSEASVSMERTQCTITSKRDEYSDANAVDFILQGCASKMRTLNCKIPDNDGAVGFILNLLQRPLNQFSIYSNV
jgi:hypothetical protein